MEFTIVAKTKLAKSILPVYTNPKVHMATTYHDANFEIDHDKLKSYKPKGKKRIKQFSIPPVCFDAIYEHYYNYFYLGIVKDLDLWNNITFGLWIHHYAFFLNCRAAGETQQFRVILNTRLFKGWVASRNLCIKDAATEGLTKLVAILPSGSYDVELISNPSCSLSEIWSAEPRKIRADFLKAAKDVSKEELQQLVDDYGSPSRPKPRAYRSTTHKNVVVKWNDCIYQDIHKAHANFLLDLFSENKSIVNWVNHHIEESNKAKLEGNKELSDYHKAFPNILVGCFHMENKKTGEPIKWFNGVDTRPLYNRCVLNTYLQISKQVNEIRGSKTEEVYSQTDGFILQHPNWSKVKSSDKIGEFGTEQIDNNQVWTYYQPTTKETTGYCVYQYFKNGVKKVVGDLPDVLKQKIDLSKGQVVSYKQTTDKHHFIKYENIQIIKAEEIEKC